MEPEDFEQHLSQIGTQWSAVLQAHDSNQATAGQSRLLERYRRAVYRYLLGAVRDPHVADDLFQEFALRLVRGDFHRANPERGRFRDFLKTSLYHLIVDFQRRKHKQMQDLPEDPAAEEASVIASDREFLDVWRGELMARAWEALQTEDQQTGQQLYAVLRFRTDHPEMRSPEMAEHFSRELNKPISPEWVRKRLHYARDKFADLLVAEVARGLQDASPDRIEEELLALGLFEHCRDAVQRLR